MNAVNMFGAFRGSCGSRGVVRGIVALMVLVVVSLSAGEASAQLTARTLIGKAVSDSSADQDVTNAINRFRDRDIDGCLALLERVRSNDPKLPPPGVMMAMLWMSVNQVPRARAALEETTVKFAGDPEPYLMLGDLAFQERRVTEADALFSRAVELTNAYAENPKRKRDFEIRCHAGTAAVAEARKQWAKAEADLRAWLALDPDNATAHQRLGIVLFQLGKAPESLEQFREAKKLDDKVVQPEVAMARLYDEAKKREMAKKAIEAAIKEAPKDPGVLLFAAQWYLGQGDTETAKARAEEAMKLDPKSFDAKIVRAAVARMSRDYQTAEQLFNEAHTQSPGNFQASNSLALVLIESEVKEARQRALELAEVNFALHQKNSPQQVQVNALTTLAWIYYKLGRREDAEQILAQITQNNLLTTDGAFYVARLLSDRGETQRARNILEEVLANEQMFPTRRDAEDLLAKLKSEGGKAEKEEGK